MSLSGDQAQADAMDPGARFRDADPWVYACWRSSQVLPVALQLAKNTFWGEHETAPVVTTAHWRSPLLIQPQYNGPEQESTQQPAPREATKGCEGGTAMGTGRTHV